MNTPTDIAAEQAPATAQTRALVSPSTDFWLVGGASGLFFVFFCLIPFQYRLGFEDRLSITAVYLAYLVNYPHFAYSYLLFYRGFRARVADDATEPVSRLRYLTAGIAVPLCMTLYFIGAYHTADPSFIVWSYFIMSFTVGWHYVKQGYGVLITLGLYENVFYTVREKRVLWVNAYAVWIASSWYLALHNGKIIHDGPYGIIAALTPGWMMTAAILLACAASLAAGFVVLKHWLWDDKGVSCNAVVGYGAAVYMWTLMPFVNMGFLLIIPMFHSLQYLPFVFKLKKSEYNLPVADDDAHKKHMRKLWLSVFTMAGIALGAIFFQLLPRALDGLYGIPYQAKDLTFFMAAFFVFINIHHFFIDSAFWRRDNREVQQYLFRA